MVMATGMANYVRKERERERGRESSNAGRV
jgi:hypothetical protein